ncbi:MAG TPA: SCO family protein [Acetobacteraceae bacterium]|nr:SCO family protein [Acetobacteraceae bacterium]
MSNTVERSTTKPGAGRSPPPFLYAIGGLLVAVLLLGTGVFLWLSGATGGAAIGGPFTLESSTGQTVTDRAFRGKYLLVYFGYTYCPDVCPTTLNTLTAALERLGPKAKDLTPIFITVDPQRDTPQAMKQYTAAFSPALVGLTGTPDEIAKVAREYRVYYAKHVTGPGPNDYSMDHSSIIYVMGPDGRFIAPLRADESPAEMAADIQKLM